MLPLVHLDSELEDGSIVRGDAVNDSRQLEDIVCHLNEWAKRGKVTEYLSGRKIVAVTLRREPEPD